jgi:membrane protease YdiL (CAAX protease family)
LNARSLFVAADGRLHAPWRILLFVVITALSLILVAVVARPLLLGAQQVTGIALTADTVALALALLTSHAVMVYAADRRSWSYVALGADAARGKVLLRGWLLGAIPIGVPCALLLAVGWLSLRSALSGSWWIAARQVSLFLLTASLSEELLSRGYIFATLREWLGWPVALGLTSVGFGLAHLGNPGVDARAVVLVTLAGVFLGAVLIVTGSLYATWMAHWAWNWVMAVPLHAAVSGQSFSHPDYQIVDAGPDWITGGAWGPEGGAGAAGGMLIGLGYLYWRYNKKRNEQLQR